MNGPARRVDELLVQAAARLAADSDTPRLDAELLLGHVLGTGRASLRARGERPVTHEQEARLAALLERRAAGEPVAYLTGRKSFWTLDLAVGPGVLVPRPETELLVEAALERLRNRPAPAIADLGSGSGAIALALAAELPGARVTAVEASAEALAVARRNAVEAGLGNVELLQGRWFEPLAGRRFDALLSNPPYLAAADPHLASLAREPREALVSGPTGLECLADIARGAAGHLLPDGLLLLEHGAGQGAAVRGLCLAAGLEGVETLRDLAGHERVTVARARAGDAPPR